MIDALRPRRCFANLLHRRHQERDQNRNDRDDHKQLDQRKRGTPSGERFHGTPMTKFDGQKR